MLAKEGIVAPWSARFGLLGSQGGFLSQQDLGRTAIAAMIKEDAVGHTVDFCGFLTADAALPLYVGVPSNVSVCAEVLTKTHTDTLLDCAVLAAYPHDGKWRVETASASGGASLTFDALIIACDESSLASGTVGAVRSAAELDADDQVSQRLGELQALLEGQREQAPAKPLLTWSGRLPLSLSSRLPFDAVACPSSPLVRFLAPSR